MSVLLAPQVHKDPHPLIELLTHPPQQKVFHQVGRLLALVTNLATKWHYMHCHIALESLPGKRSQENPWQGKSPMMSVDFQLEACFAPEKNKSWNNTDQSVAFVKDLTRAVVQIYLYQKITRMNIQIYL